MKKRHMLSLKMYVFMSVYSFACFGRSLEEHKNPFRLHNI
jgi:hypothetical protein